MVPLLTQQNKRAFKAITSTKFWSPGINHAAIGLGTSREIAHRCVCNDFDMGEILKRLGMRVGRRASHKKALRLQDPPYLTHRVNKGVHHNAITPDSSRQMLKKIKRRHNIKA